MFKRELLTTTVHIYCNGKKLTVISPWNPLVCGSFTVLYYMALLNPKTFTQMDIRKLQRGTYFCLSRESLLRARLVRLVVGMEWTEELFLLEEWDEWEEWERLVRDWPALWSNCIRQNMRSEGTSSNAYGGLVMTYLEERDGRPVLNSVKVEKFLSR